MAAALLGIMVLGAGGGDDRLAVAVYTGPGAAPVQSDLLVQLRLDGDIAPRAVSAAQIRDGELRRFAVVIFPAGLASKQSLALGAVGLEAVREFVRAGGGYVGICAGAYLALAGRDHPRGDRLELLAAASIDPWRRGGGTVTLIPTDAEGLPVTVDYESGPVMEAIERPDLPPPTVLAHYGASEGSVRRAGLEDKAAVLAARHGDGRVLLFGPHPERRVSRSWLVRQGVRWASGRAGRPGEPLSWSTVLPPERLSIPLSRLPVAVLRAIRSAPYMAALEALRGLRETVPGPTMLQGGRGVPVYRREVPHTME